MRPSSTSISSWLAGLALTVLVAPVAVWGAFSAHEPHCEDANAFWNGDLPTGEGDVEGVVLGSSRMGMDLDVYALAEATGFPWVRVARHAIEQASIPMSYPRLLASTPARPGLKRLVIEVSPLLFDETGCGRPPLAGIPMQAHWMPAAWEMEGHETELAPAVAMGWLPHRWLMSSGRRHDVIEHLERPAHALRLLTDLSHLGEGFHPPARWRGEIPPDLSDERIVKRRQFLLGGPIDTFVPKVNATCVAVLERVIAEARAERTILVLPPVRARMRDSLPAEYRDDVKSMMRSLASRSSVSTVLVDATDRFAGAEDDHFADFDHLDEKGARAFTRDLLEALDISGPSE